MAFLGKLFKGKKLGDAPSPAEAIQGLWTMEDMLLKKQEYYEKKIETEISTAKKNAKTNKRTALAAIKRKKNYEKQLQQIDGTLTTIEQQREALETANVNTSVLQSMNKAAKAIKKAHADMSIDQVHDMMDEIAEQQDVAKEIGEAISNPAAFTQEFDEDELEAELEALELELQDEEQSQLEKELLEIEPSALPEVPKTEPKVKTKAKKAVVQDDMDELAAWAS